MLNIANVEESKCRDSSTSCCFTPEPKLILKPEIASTSGGSIQFTAFLRSRVGEIQLGSDLTFQSDNTSALTINAATGTAALIAPGTAQVTVVWQNLKAFSQVTVIADCSAVSNAFEILIDNSRSMSDRFNDVFESKLDVARLMAWQLSIAVNLGKDLIGLIGFTTYPNEIVSIGNVAISQTQFAQIQKSDAATSILEVLQLAVTNLAAQTSNRSVIALFSDGENHPKLSELQRIQMLDLANTFKMSGGVIIVVGIRAAGHGYDLLQNLASAGYFINVLADNGETHVDKSMGLLEGLLPFVCSPTPAYLLAYLYEQPASTYPLPPQTADPLPLECDGELKGVRPHYRGTRTYNNGTAPVSAICNSDVSQEDADARALELAMIRWTMLQFASVYE